MHTENVSRHHSQSMMIMMMVLDGPACRCIPNIVQNQAFSRVEADPEVPLLPRDAVALNLHMRTYALD